MTIDERKEGILKGEAAKSRQLRIALALPSREVSVAGGGGGATGEGRYSCSASLGHGETLPPFNFSRMVFAIPLSSS